MDSVRAGTEQCQKPSLGYVVFQKISSVYKEQINILFQKVGKD